VATAPFLLLIVAALPRAEALPVASTITHEARAAVATVVARVVASENEQDRGAQLAVAHAPVAKKSARPTLIAALPTPPLEVETPPVLAVRVEFGEPRGPLV
jgi:hypothetical protein